jgi:putative ABC transport system permease protein
MSLWTRLRNTFRNEGLQREIDEELESHIAEAIAQGRDPDEARRAFLLERSTGPGPGKGI